MHNHTHILTPSHHLCTLVCSNILVGQKKERKNQFFYWNQLHNTAFSYFFFVYIYCFYDKDYPNQAIRRSCWILVPCQPFALCYLSTAIKVLHESIPAEFTSTRNQSVQSHCTSIVFSMWPDLCSRTERQCCIEDDKAPSTRYPQEQSTPEPACLSMSCMSTWKMAPRIRARYTQSIIVIGWYKDSSSITHCSCVPSSSSNNNISSSSYQAINTATTETTITCILSPEEEKEQKEQPSSIDR